MCPMCPTPYRGGTFWAHQSKVQNNPHRAQSFLHITPKELTCLCQPGHNHQTPFHAETSPVVQAA
jgi:hypothetical protein